MLKYWTKDIVAYSSRYKKKLERQWDLKWQPQSPLLLRKNQIHKEGLGPLSSVAVKENKEIKEITNPPGISKK